jgi:hypothetical protein
MQKIKKSFLLCLSFFLFLNPLASAQQGGDILKETMTDMYIVAGAGLGGAVLGLSTLSFVEEPSEHLNNIIVGGAIGIIIGVGVVAWRQANKSSDLYKQNAFNGQKIQKLPQPEFTTAMRTGWHRKNHYEFSSKLGKSNAPANSAFNVQFSF